MSINDNKDQLYISLYVHMLPCHTEEYKLIQEQLMTMAKEADVEAEAMERIDNDPSYDVTELLKETYNDDRNYHKIARDRVWEEKLDKDYPREFLGIVTTFNNAREVFDEYIRNTYGLEKTDFEYTIESNGINRFNYILSWYDY